jgi:transposase
MAPLLRRSWAPRGCAPILRQRTRHHQKVSVIAALSVTPQRTRVGLCFRLHPAKSITWREVRAFLRHLLRHLPGPILLIWDRLHAHRSTKLRDLVRSTPRLHVAFLPPYAPELNPVENIWSYLKINPMANLPIHDVDALQTTARRHGRGIQRREPLLRSFIEHSPLSLRLG